MNKNVMNLLLIGGGAAAVYWYLTNYGPSGAAYNATGQQIAATWWQTWFSGTAAPAVADTSTNPLSTSAVNTPTAPVTAGTGLPATPVSTTSPANSGPSSVTPNAVDVKTQLVRAASQNAFFQAQGGEGDAYQWATLWNGLGRPQFDVNATFYPNGFTAQVGAAGMSQQGLPLISLTTFLSTLQSAGIATGLSGMGALRGIIDLPSFGSNRGFSGAFKGARGNKAVN